LTAHAVFLPQKGKKAFEPAQFKDAFAFNAEYYKPSAAVCQGEK